MLFAPGRKFGDRPGIGFPSVRVADIRRKEFDELLGCGGRRGEEGGERSGFRNRELNSLCHAVPYRHISV